MILNIEKKKKELAVFAAFLLGVGALSGCGNATKNEDTGSANNTEAETTAEETESAGKYTIVTTIFPEYDWVREILGERFEDYEVVMLSDAGVDLHSFNPTVDDIVTISDCDLFIYVGGESDAWVSGALAEARNKDMKVVNLLETLGDSAREEEIVEGMQEEAHDHDDADYEDEDHDEHGEEDHEDEEVEYDEHVWLSLRNAAVLVDAIEAEISSLDAEYAEIYQENAAVYKESLSELDRRFEETVNEGEKDTLLFADRFPFRYLVDDYDLNYYAAFSGCSAETEASFETITFLAQKVDELGLSVVLTMEETDPKIANTVISNTENKDQKILSMNSMQAVTAQDITDGITYLDLMEQNRQILETALKGEQ